MGLGYYVDDLAVQQQTFTTVASERQQTCPGDPENATSNVKSMEVTSTEWPASNASQLDAAHSLPHAEGDENVKGEQETQQRSAFDDADVSMFPDSSEPAAPSRGALSQPPTKAEPDAADTQDPQQCIALIAGVSRDHVSRKIARRSSAATELKAQHGVVNEESNSSRKGEEDSEVRSRDERHYWGQALQYLDKSADVVPGAPLNVNK